MVWCWTCVTGIHVSRVTGTVMRQVGYILSRDVCIPGINTIAMKRSTPTCYEIKIRRAGSIGTQLPVEKEGGVFTPLWAWKMTRQAGPTPEDNLEIFLVISPIQSKGYHDKVYRAFWARLPTLEFGLTVQSVTQKKIVQLGWTEVGCWCIASSF